MKKLSFQKLFCFISILFILSCCIFYGTRFIKLYIENEKNKQSEENSLVKVIKENNIDNPKLKEINGSLYFIDDSNNNYLLYSNILWRIIKLNNDNSITIISDKPLTSLAFGKNVDYEKSNINRWLNNQNDDELSGILIKQLNNTNYYLQKTPTCLDTVDTINNELCKNINTDNYISLLSTIDFVNIGNKESYVINNTYFYLNNQNSNNEIWYVSNDGKITTSNGFDIFGIRPVITIKSNIDYIDGNGNLEKPYTLEKENGLFGSYVKLDNMLWRIYQVNENDIRLVLNDYLKVNNQKLTYQYSNNSSYHDDTVYGSIAYYLNHTFLNSLSYKNLIEEVYWSNGFYSDNTNYNYEDSLKTKVNTKVALISIGDILLNNELENYFTMTGTSNHSSSIYSIQKNGKVSTKNIGTSLNVVPAINLKKELLTKGNGTIDSPYEME